MIYAVAPAPSPKPTPCMMQGNCGEGGDISVLIVAIVAMAVFLIVARWRGWDRA